MRRFVAVVVCLAGFASVPGVAAAQLVPFADCVTVTDDPEPGVLRVLFGYRNLTSTTFVFEGGGENNFVIPAPPNRPGQPEMFLPGEFHQVFAVEVAPNEKAIWALNGVGVAVDRDFPRCIPFPTWLGPWNGSFAYSPDHIVSSAGSSWIAMRANTGLPPGQSDAWQLVAMKGDMGPRGLQGERGATGPQGLQGVPGTPGDSHSFPASPIYTLPANGTLVVIDPNVRADSLVHAMYVGGSLLPPVVTRVVAGQLTVVGVPQKRFRYIVFK